MKKKTAHINEWNTAKKEQGAKMQQRNHSTLTAAQKRGQTQAQARESRKKYGTNALQVQKGKSFLSRFFANLNDPIIRILIGAMVISSFLLLRDGCLSEVCGIGGAVLLSTLVSTVSECGSERAFARLQAQSRAVTCKVLREGSYLRVPVDDLTVGDVVYLEAGEQVPADGFLIEGELNVDLSALNGESKERARVACDTVDTEYGLDTHNVLLRGASVTGGSGKMWVGRVGEATLYGHLAKEIQGESVESPLKNKLSHLAGILSKIGYFSAILVVSADLIYSFFLSAEPLTLVSVAQNLIHALTLGITVIVVAVPEGLPMMITVVLSANMLRMLRNQVLVRKPVGIETAGGVEILFTDKTGTLTCGTPKVHAYLYANGEQKSALFAVPTPLRALLVQSAWYNTASVASGKEALGGNATDRLLLLEALSHKKERWCGERIAFSPFNSTDKYSRAVLRTEGEVYTLYKGAPERILAACRRCCTADGGTRALSECSRLLHLWREGSARGERFLAIAMAKGDVSLDHELILVALVCIKDAVRREAKRAVKELQGAGVQVVMMTGDHKNTARAVAVQSGVLTDGDGLVLSGEELHAMTDAQIAALLPQLRVVARALPTDKSRLVRIAQGLGRVVGMTGDGLNDAPALKAADVGFAMGNGTQVTKEAADIVILDNNIASISRAVLFGRTIFGSIRKFITFQLTMNLCAVLVSMLAPFVGIDTPITVMQMLWINLIMDTLAGLAFAGEAPERATMRQKPITRTTPVLTRRMAAQIFGMGGYCVLLSMLFLKNGWIAAQYRPMEGKGVLLTAFFTLFVFSGVLCAFHARTPKGSMWRGLFQNRSFLLIMSAVLGVQMVMIYFGGSTLRCVPLTRRELCLTLALAATVLPAEGARKMLFVLFGRKRKERLDRMKKV